MALSRPHMRMKMAYFHSNDGGQSKDPRVPRRALATPFTGMYPCFLRHRFLADSPLP